jgi:hypothetical protein
MATITGLTAERMQEIIDSTIVDAEIVGDNLILEKYDATTIDAGDVRGPQGVPGATFTVCTSTTRPLGLGVPDEGLAIYETDTNRMYVWNGTAWVLLSTYFTFANAAARTAHIITPLEGQATYLQDVDTFEIYQGTAWRKPWNMPWGEIGYTEIAANNFGTGLAAVDLMSVVFTTPGNRKIKVTGDVQCSHVGGDGTATLYIRTAVNAILNQRGLYVAGNGLAFPLHVEKRYTPAAATITLKLSINTSTNTVDVQASSSRPSYILVEDMGPSGTAP